MSDDFDSLSDDALFSYLAGAAGESDMRLGAAFAPRFNSRPSATAPT